MHKNKAIAASSIFFAVAPGVVAVLVPFLLTGWRARPIWGPIRVLGAALAVAGAGVLLHSFWRFINEGGGTPAPIAPTARLVTGGAYRFVRNPMYISVLTAVLGQGLLLAQPVLFIYGSVIGILMVAFVLLYEEPVLSRTYGAEYEEYRRAVPGWIPRLSPWAGRRS